MAEFKKRKAAQKAKAEAEAIAKKKEETAGRRIQATVR